MCDNLTVTSCINNTGNIKYGSCNKIACNLWDFCIIEKLWILAAYMPSVSNKKTDKHSRILDDTEE